MDQFEEFTPDQSQEEEIPLDSLFEHQVYRLHGLTVLGRWCFVALLWLALSPWCLWAFRGELALWQDYFTWTAIRYGLADHYWATLGLAFCIAMTLATLIWQSRNILWGLPKRDRRRLEQEVCRIRQQGSSHPLWKWVCR
jgi:hypothetical protein